LTVGRKQWRRRRKNHKQAERISHGRLAESRDVNPGGDFFMKKIAAAVERLLSTEATVVWK
jgi:hypothetical protein